MKKLIALTLALMLAMAAVSALAESEAEKVPTLEDMADLMMEDENTIIDESVFEGEWVVSATFLGDEYIAPEALAEMISFNFGPITIGGGKIVQEYTENGETKTVDLPYVLEAGQLQCKEGETVNGLEFVVEPLVDGSICYSLFIPDAESNINCATIFMVRREA